MICLIPKGKALVQGLHSASSIGNGLEWMLGIGQDYCYYHHVEKKTDNQKDDTGQEDSQRCPAGTLAYMWALPLSELEIIAFLKSMVLLYYPVSLLQKSLLFFLYLLPVISEQ